MAQVNLEYLIEQVQELEYDIYTTEATSKILDLTLQHPVKELFWVYQTNSQKRGSTNIEFDSPNYSKTTQPNHFTKLHTAGTTFGIKINGINRFEPRRGEFFMNVQQYL